MKTDGSFAALHYSPLKELRWLMRSSIRAAAAAQTRHDLAISFSRPAAFSMQA